MNPKIEEIIEALRCRAHGDACAEDCLCYSNKDFDCVSNFTVLTAAVDCIEQLQQELIDERYRHDRLQDFCVAQGEELARLKAQQRWIPVTERLPEDGKECLIWAASNYAELAWYNPGYDVFCAENFDCSLDEITHWMPLPEVPKE